MDVTIYEPLLTRLLAGPRPYAGTLVGLWHDGAAHLLGCLLDHVDGGTPGTGSELLTALPGGVRPLGVAGECHSQLRQAGLLDSVLTLLPDGVPAAVVVTLGAGGGGPAPAVHLCADGVLSETSFGVVSEDELRRRTVLLRVEGALALRCAPTADALVAAFDRLESQLDSPAAYFVQHGDQGRLLCARGAGDERGVCGDLRPRKADAPPPPFRLLLRRSGLGESPGAPVVQYSRGKQQLSELTLALSCLALLPAGAPLSAAGAALRQATLRQLARFRSAVGDVLAEKRRLVPAAALHFRPESCGHHLTLVYSDASPDEQLESYRRDLHAALLLPADRPVFRRPNQLRFNDVGPYLTDVHVGLQPPGGADSRAQVALVRGSYAYHHYMQDHVDDSGWGCAYRSLQTLASWLRRQGYTARPPPSHRQVQQCLVGLGDKPAAFVGSHQWIGSTEVSFCLRGLYQVESRILHVSSGAELTCKGRALLHHFQTEGTPVMVGGGVLAHTLLGVSFDEVGGETAFLVLDPHYTGAERLDTVQTKGWCGWKDGTFWDPAAYYNLCMPIRPRCV